MPLASASVSDFMGLEAAFQFETMRRLMSSQVPQYMPSSKAELYIVGKEYNVVSSQDLPKHMPAKHSVYPGQPSAAWRTPVEQVRTAGWHEPPGLESESEAGRAVAMQSEEMAVSDVAPSEGATQFQTVMMKNLPNKYTKKMLLEVISERGFADTFDFFYLPIDPSSGVNKGYAFINFIDVNTAWTFKTTFEGCAMPGSRSDKVVSVIPAHHQGYEANYAKYSTKRVCRGDPRMRPLFLRCGGAEVPEPDARANGHRSRGGRLRQTQHRPAEEAALKMDGLLDGDFDPSLAMSSMSIAAVGIQGFGHTSEVGRNVAGYSQPRQNDMPGRGVVTLGVRQFCKYCGVKVGSHFRFCHSCGSALD